jgi:hypothetical protein
MYVLLIIVGVCALGAALVAFGRTPRRDEVERFHRARAMTTEWSKHYAATGHLELPNERNGHGNGNNGSGHAPSQAHDREREPAEPR